MKQRRGNERLTAVLMGGEAAALWVVLVVLGMFVWMSLGGHYEVLISANSYGECYAELALLCVIAVLVTVDLICRFAQLRREVVRKHGK